MQVLHFRVGSFPGCTAALFLLLALKLPGQVAETNLAVTVRHAPSLNGRGTIEGSLQLLSGENVTVNGGFALSGDLMVPGTPALRLNGHPQTAGTIPGAGSSNPSGYQVLLNGNCSIHFLRTRTAPVPLPAVAVPARPAGTRSLVMTNPGQSLGDPATLRNLTLDGNVGQAPVPPGDYGDFIANGGSGFTLGVAGATEPSHYNLQNLTLNGQSRIEVLGPVVLTVANGVTANGILGASGQPSWLRLQLAAGGFTLNGGCTLHGSVVAPAGTVIVNGNSLLIGSVQSDRLIVNSGGIIRAGISANQAPVASAQALSSSEDGSLEVTLTGTDPEGANLSYVLLSQPVHGTLTGDAPELTYAPAANFSGTDSFTFKVNDGQADSAAATVSITVVPINDAPVAQAQTLSTPEDTDLNITLAGSDAEDDPLSFELVTLTAHGTLNGTAPNLAYSPVANYQGPDRFTFRVHDGQTLSEPETVLITVEPVDDAPVASAQHVALDEDSPAAITLTAVDVEGDGLVYTILTRPAHGILSGTPPDVSYLPATNYNGSDSFTFYVSDWISDSTPATVTLAVRPVNDTPVAAAQVLASLEDTATNVVLTASDAEGSPLAYSIVSPPSHGTLSGDAPALVYSPAANYHGPDSFTFQASDGELDSAQVSVSLNLISVNDAPVADAATLTTAEDTELALTLTGSDVDEDPLGYTIVTQPAHGVLSGLAPAVVYTPATNYHGPDSFVFKVDDGELDSEETVTIEISPVNDPPLIDAGPDLRVTVGQPVMLRGSVADDGFPDGVSPFVVRWTLAGGNGLFELDDPSSASTVAVFRETGTYLLKLTADDSLASASDELTVTVLPINQAPVVTAGPKQLVVYPSSVALLGAAVDDGLPENSTLTFAWSKISGPGGVAFGDSSATNTSAGFTEPGDYVLRLTANDSSLASFADVKVAVRTPAMNVAPAVNAGADKVVGLTNVLILNGGVDDDGLPQGATLAADWSVVSGPGNVAFDHSAITNVRATFNAVGTYVLRLTANDSALSASDDVSVTVYPYNQPPVVDAGPDQTITLPDPELLYPHEYAITNVTTYLSRSLMSVDHWNESFGVPGVSGVPAGGFVWISRNGLDVDRGRLVVAGGFTNAGGIFAKSIAMFDGTNWHSFYDPTPLSYGDGVDHSGGMTGTNVGWLVYNCGSAEFCNEVFNCAAIRGEEVFAGGMFKELEVLDGLKDMTARWTGSRWRSWGFKRVGNNAQIIKAASQKVYVAGEICFQATNASAQTFTNLPWSYGIAEWDGTNWNALGPGIMDIGDNPLVPSGYPKAFVSSMAVAPNGDVYAAGQFVTLTPSGYATNIARWNGQEWQPLGSGLAISGIGGGHTPGMAVADNGDLYVGGAFTNAGGVPVRNAARWDGTRWWPLGSGALNGANGGVIAVAIHGRDVYFGGNFSEAGGLTANHLAKWDGQFWRPLGVGSSNGIYGQVTALDVDETGLYVGGMFSKAGGFAASNLAKWEFTVPPPQLVQLNGRVTDDGLPADGQLSMEWTKVSGPGDVLFSDPDSAISTAAFTKAGTYVLRLSANDSDLSALDEVTVVVRANQPPVVDAGPDQITGRNQPLSLTASVSDDGLPQGAAVHHVWSMLYGPGTVTFDHPDQNQVVARFSLQGTYVLRFAANDSHFTSLDDVTVVVNSPGNQPPVVNPGSSTTIVLGSSYALKGSVSDDGFPAGVLKWSWSVASGPAAVNFDDANRTNAIASFSTNGTYVLRLTASDSELSSSANVTITVQLANNTVPIVSAGPDQVLSNYFTRLQGVVSDDGQPVNGALNPVWAKGGGPGTVSFASSNSPTTTVAFSQSGNYVLRLTVSDGQFTAFDDVNISIPNQRPVVNAGPDRTIVWPTKSLALSGQVFDTSAFSVTWQRMSGPGTVAFSPNNAVNSTVTFSTVGTNVLRLNAYESGTNYPDELIVIVSASSNQPPTVSAGADQTLSLPTRSIALQGTVSDDNLPNGSTTLLWTQVCGPVQATFDSPQLTNSTSLQPIVSLDALGTYVFRLTASDSVLTNGDEVTITLCAQENAPPIVQAGPDLVGRVTNAVIATAEVVDDGLPEGRLLNAFWRKLSGPGTVTFSPIQINGTSTNLCVTTSMNFGLIGNYVLRLSAEDSEYSASDDLAVTILSADDNLAPIVNAGVDANTTAYQPFTLNGAVTDDGLPAGANIGVMWSVASGPAKVYFSSANSLSTYAQFPATGNYTLRLTANDTRFAAFDEVAISVSAPVNEPPFVFAGPPDEITRPAPAYLEGVIIDDGLPLGYPLSVAWSKVSGPGEITFVPDANDPVAQAHFSAAGQYTLRLSASDSVFDVADEIIINVLPGTNAPPSVNAGPDMMAALREPAVLHTQATDDGLEQGLLQVSWSQLSGPGMTLFSTVNGAYRATFTAVGDYTLRLTAHDGSLTNSDDVVVTVVDAAPPIARLDCPLDGSVITSPTNLIGTASSPILQSYVIEYRLKPAEGLGTWNLELGTSSPWSLLASNTTPVESNTLAVFDPTLLLNGTYELRLTATDLAGRSAITDPVTFIVDGNLKIGHFTISFNDLAIPVPGLPLQVTRTYDSRAAAAGIQGDFGIGWTMDISNVRLQKNRPLSRNWTEYTTGGAAGLSLIYHLDPGSPRIVTITFPDGRVEKFRLDPYPLDQPLIPINYPQWRFTPIGNTRGSLVPAGYNDPDGSFLYFADAIPGTGNLYDLNFFFETVGNFSGGAATEEDLERYPTLFRYTSPEGSKYLIDELAGLQSVTDPNGNTLLVSTNGITWQNLNAGTNTLSIAFQRDGGGRITNIVDAAGSSMNYGYSSNGDLIAFRNRDGETNAFSYDGGHRLLTLTDCRGIDVLENAYDGTGRLTSTRDPLGYSTGYFHDLQNQREFVTNRLGFVTINEYDAYGNVTRITDPLGFVRSFSYDSNGNLLAKSNATDCACGERYTYDASDNKISETDAEGNTTTYTYNGLRKILTMVDPSGFGTTNTYDAAGNLLATRDSAGQVTTFAYNNLGKVVAMTDPKGTTRYGYNHYGYLIALTNALGHVTEFAVDAHGNPLSQSIRVTRVTGLASIDQFKRDWKLAGDAVGPSPPVTNAYRLVMRYEYTDGGLPLRTLYYDGSSSSNVYENGKPTVITDALGRETRSIYDGAGRMVRKIYPEGCSEDFAYDAEGQLISSTDRRGFVTHFDYDPRGKLVRTRFADGSQISATFYEDGALHTETSKSGEVITYGLDRNRNRIAVTDASGITTYTYNYRNHATSKKDPLNRSTAYVYDALGRNTAILYPDGHSKLATFSGRLVTSETDQNGNTTLYDYDCLGRLIRVTDGAGGITAYTYDEQGNKTSQTDALGRTTYFENDDMGRLVRIVYPDGSSVSKENDAAGRLISQTSPMGDVTRFEYDLGDHLLASTDPLGNVTRFSYDSGGNKLTQTDPDGKITKFEYDSLSRLVKTTFPCGTTEINTYDSAGRLIAQTDQAGKTTLLGYDIRNQLRTVTDPTGKIKSFEYDTVGNRVSEIDALGQITRHVYDTLDRLVSTTAQDGTAQEFGYDAVGHMTTHLDQAGNVSRLSYDPVGRLTATSDALGLVTHFGYDAVGDRTSMTDPDGKTTTYEHDVMGRVTRTVFPDGSSQSTSYDKCGLPVTVTDALGKATILNFDAAGRRTSVTDPLNHKTLFAYDGAGHLTSRTDANNDTTRFEYDCLGRLARTVYPDGSSSSTSYDANGHPSAVIDPNGNTTGFAYDDMGRLTTQTDPLNHVTTYAYDALGRLHTRADALGRKTTYEYDALGRCTAITHPDSTSETFAYDARGNRISQTDPAGNLRTFSYDAANRLVSQTDALGHSTQYSFDTLGRLSSVTDANGHTASYTYDPLGHLVQVAYADGSTREYAYDLQGRRTSETDQAGITKQYRYDDAGRLIAVVDALNHESSFAYDPVGRLITQTDANGRATRFEYNARGWRTKRTLPGGQAESLTYDHNGNVTQRISFKGSTTTYAYDARNQLTQKIPDPELCAAGAVPITFSYTATGRRETMTDAGGTTRYSYDSMDRLTAKGTPLGRLDYTYNANGTVKSISSSNPNGTSVAYAYDAADRLTKVAANVTGHTAYTYDPAGNLIGTTQPNAVVQTYAYDDLNRLTGVEALDAQSAKVSDFAYTLDRTGHRLSAIEVVAAATQNPQPATILRTYTYDDLYRLETEAISGASSTGAVTYAYDAAANRLNRGSTLPLIPPAAYSYDVDNRLAGDGCDADGNTTNAWMRDPLSVLTNQVSDRFDFEDQLTERTTTLDSQPATISVVYDGDGNRVSKTVTTGTNTVTTFYLVDDRNPTGYSQVLEELTKDATLATPAVMRVCTYGLSLLSQDQVISNQWLTSYYGVDGHGSVRYLTDTNGVITDTYDFDAFGNLIGRTGSTPNNHLFAGEQFDPDLNLYYLRARYADPDRGRFWTQDSFEGFSDDPSSWHKYTFCQNDPVNLIDPSGHYSLAESMMVGAIAPTVRGMVLDQFSGINNYAHGLAGGSALKATSTTEAYMIDSLAQGPGWQMGKQEFWAATKGAPFLLSWNPNIVQGAKKCHYECIPFNLDSPIYGPSAKFPLFEMQKTQLGTLAQFMAGADGGWVGNTVRNAAAYWHSVGGESVAINFVAGMTGSVLDMMGSAVSPEQMYAGVERMERRASVVMQRELETGGNGVWATLQAASGVVGDLVGYNAVLEASFNINRETLQQIGGVSDRWSHGMMGASQLMMTGVGMRAGMLEYEGVASTVVTRAAAHAEGKIEALGKLRQASWETASEASKALVTAEKACMEPPALRTSLIPDTLKQELRHAERGLAKQVQVAKGTEYTYSAINPGPLPDKIAETFGGGRYSEGIVQSGQAPFYKGGDALNPGGSFFNFEPPSGIAQVRIDNAVRPQWINPQTGVLEAQSPINSSISAAFPVGTKYYYGPVSSQSGVYIGGVDRIQIYVPNARNTGTFTILGPLQ